MRITQRLSWKSALLYATSSTAARSDGAPTEAAVGGTVKMAGAGDTSTWTVHIMTLSGADVDTRGRACRACGSACLRFGRHAMQHTIVGWPLTKVNNLPTSYSSFFANSLDCGRFRM